MPVNLTQLLSGGTSWALVGGWALGVLALALLVIGLTAICRAERKDIPATLQALAGWLPWSAQNKKRRR